MIVRQSWIWPGVLWLVWSGIVTCRIEHEQQRLVPDPNEVELAEKTFVGGHESRETYQGSAHQGAEESREPFLWEEQIRAKSQSLAQELKPDDLKVVEENVHDQVRIDVHASRHNPEFSREDSATTLHRTANIQFSLRHIAHHGSHRYPRLHVRLDLDHELFRPRSYALSTQPQPIQRLRDRSVPAMQRVYDGARRGDNMALDADAWTVDTVLGPNITDKPTVLTLARMANDAYVKEPGTGDWRDVDSGSEYNHSQSFGWESDGLRGHIFATPNNDTVVVAIKGTSPAVFDGAETTTSDKINDNLFFACCCGQGGQYLWHQVCDCMTSAFTCNQTCLVTALREENRYYKASIELYGNVTALYPQSNIWLVGHSLGGATSALLGLTFGLPVVTFEAPGEALAAARLGLPAPPGMVPNAPQTRKLTGAYHFGHTADPIFMGSCNAATSACTLGGYAMQTVCHTGQVCRYDTVQDKGWRVGAGYHKIKNVIPDVIEVYDQPAACVPDDGCIDCFNWKYFESNSSSSITTSISSITSTTSATRTATCQTPGWWGCLDESTSATTSTTSASLPSTSCVKYGWFGGCVETTTISPTTWSSVPATASATTTRSNQDL